MRRLAEVKTLSPVVVVRDASHRSRLMIMVLHIPPEQGRNTIADALENLFLSAQISAQTKQKLENSMTVADRSGSF